MTVESRGRRVPTRVWALKCLPGDVVDGDAVGGGGGRATSPMTVVSGDSLGHVQFWDGGTGTLLDTFRQNDDGADVLDLAVSGDGMRVFASGVDSRVICVERSDQHQHARGQRAAETVGAQDARWMLTQAQRPHSHDVRSLAICHKQESAVHLPHGVWEVPQASSQDRISLAEP